MDGEKRKSGIDLIGDIPWGTHFCQFYETPKDLTDILVPYFKAGLESNECCVWVTAEPLGEESAREAMRKAMPDFDRYLEKGQIEIVSHDQWYLKGGAFDLQRVLNSWIDKLEHALEHGYDGVRVTGNTAWLEKKDWKSFTEYEEKLNSVIGNYRMMAICTYSLDRCGAAEVIDVVSNHQFALIRRRGKWQLMESTEHKQARESLRRTEENFRRSLDDSPLGVRIVSADGETLYANRSILDIYGYNSLEELKRTPIKKHYTPESYAEFRIRKEKRQRGEYVPSNYEASIVRKNGEIRHLEVFRKEVLWDDKPQFQVLYNDITEHKKAEEELLKFKTITDQAGYGATVTSVEGIFSYVNEAFARMHGYTPEELVGEHYSILYTEEQLKAVKQIRDASIKEGRYFAEEIWRKKKDGTMFPTFNTNVIIKDDTGKPLYLSAVVMDITERKRAEDALRQSEDKFVRLFRMSPVAMRLIELDSAKTVDANDSFVKLTGYSRDEIIGHTTRELGIIREPPTAHAERIKTIMKYGKLSASQISIFTKSGEERICLMSSELLNLGGKDHALNALNDITEHKRAEEGLQRIEKLESVGRLAGGIAHDFNNILTAILGNITLAERHIEPKGKAAERLLEAKKASVRAKGLTQQLLTFSRGGAPIKEVASIAELLEESALFALRGSDVKCEFSLPDDLWSIEIDRGQMSQVITNLVINADEAMPEGGLLAIRAKNTVIEREGVLPPLPEGDYVEITVEDYGVGIPKEHLGRIFDPYFTTKQKGTGLGLATTHSIIKNHGGCITVESEPGAGTTFHIYLPASKKPVTKKEEVEEAVQAAFPGRKRILVMDDEETIRDMLSNMLSTAGFEVELASDGKEAIERYEKAMELGQPFDAVIMDLTIPGGMGGKEAIKELIKIDPDVKAIVSSGYSTDPIMADAWKYGFSAVMTKPYSISEMENTLRRILVRAKKNHSEE